MTGELVLPFPFPALLGVLPEHVFDGPERRTRTLTVPCAPSLLGVEPYLHPLAPS